MQLQQILHNLSEFTIYQYSRQLFIGISQRDLEYNTQKCPDIYIKINDIEDKALIHTGSTVNALCEEWLTANYEQMKLCVAELQMHNMQIITAIGNKYKFIRK